MWYTISHGIILIYHPQNMVSHVIPHDTASQWIHTLAPFLSPSRSDSTTT